MNKKSVAFLVSHDAPGGVQELWPDLAEGFARRGFSASLLALYPGHGSAKDIKRPSKWKYLICSRKRNIFSNLNLFIRLVKYLRREQPATLFTAMPAANIIGGLAASIARCGTNVVMTHHTPVDTYNEILNLLDGLVGKLRSVSAIISVSESVRKSLEKKGNIYLSKTRVIRNALPPEIEDLLAGLTRGVREESSINRIVIAIGRLVAQKNHITLIRAASYLQDVEIRIIGAGELRSVLQSIAVQENTHNQIRFFGQLSREETLYELSQADVFIQPSLFEGHSLALLEAAKMNIPLVVSEIPVQIEGITARDGKRCGVAVPALDHVELASEITKLLDDPEHYKMMSKNAQILASHSRFEDMLNEYIALSPVLKC